MRSLRHDLLGSPLSVHLMSTAPLGTELDSEAAFESDPRLLSHVVRGGFALEQESNV